MSDINKVRSSGPHLQWVKNTTGKIEDIITREEWDKANPPLSRPEKSFFDHTIDAFKDAFTAPFKQKRPPIVKVRKTKSLFNLLFGWSWKWECRICYQNRLASTWEKAVEQATHHAHNHHRSQK